MKCEWCGQQNDGAKGPCALCGQSLQSRPYASEPLGSPGGVGDSAGGASETTSSGKGKSAFLVLLLIAALAGGLYWFFQIREPDDTAAPNSSPTTSEVDPFSGATECSGGIYVTGKWGCEYGQAVADALNNVSPDLKTPGVEVPLSGIFDVASETSYSMVCLIEEPVECVWSAADKVLITTQ